METSPVTLHATKNLCIVKYLETLGLFKHRFIELTAASFNPVCRSASFSPVKWMRGTERKEEKKNGVVQDASFLSVSLIHFTGDAHLVSIERI